MTDLIRNGTIVQIPETDKDNTKLVHVLQRINGLTVSDRKVLVDDLLDALFGMMENYQLTRLILKNGDVELQEIFEPIFADSDDTEVVFKCINLIINWVTMERDQGQLAFLFGLLAEQFDFSKIDESTLNQMLIQLLKKVDTLSDESKFIALFQTLLRKVDIAESNKETISILLQQLGSRITSEKDQNVKRWFQELVTSYVPNQKTITTPLLPSGTILYQEEVSGRKVVVLEIPKQRWDIQYYQTPYENVGHPKMLFEFIISGKNIRNCRIYAMKNENLKPSSKLYHYPFGNVHASFEACWPQLKEIKIDRLTQLRNLPQLFFKSAMNDHLYSGKNQREKIMALQGNDFDDETLDETGLTIADQFEMLNYSDDISE